VLITKSGTIGRLAVVDVEKEFSLFVSVALIKPCKAIVFPKYLAYVLEDYISKIDIANSIKGGLVKNFHLEDIRESVITLCTMEEQKKMVDEIESLFSVIDKLEQTIDVSLGKTEKLRKSILNMHLKETCKLKRCYEQSETVGR